MSERLLPMKQVQQNAGLTIAEQNVKNIQIGGNHYKDMAIQPGEFITKNGLGWYEGNAVKYICRHKMKGGKQDLEKAIHYLQLAIQDFYDKEKT